MSYHDHDESKITAQDPGSNVGELVDWINKLKLSSGVQRTIAAIATNSAGTCVDFSAHNICDAGAVGIGEGLIKNVTLLKLYLGQNKICDIGAGGIGEGLRKNVALQKLYLGENNISDFGASAIGKGLSENTTLRILVLNGNNIRDAGAASIGEGLIKNVALQILRLDRNNISDIGTAVIGAALSKNVALQELRLNTNNICDAGASAIGEGLSTNVTLQIIYLDNNSISDVGTAAIGEGLSKNTTLQNLHLDGNKITQAGYLALAKGFRLNENLTILDANPEATNYVETDIIKEIGRGEFGSVSLASTDDGLEVVEKTSHGTNGEEIYERLMLQGLPEHKNVVRVAAISDEDTLLLEAHKGGSLKQYAGAQEDGTPLPQFLSYSHGMCQAIEHLHKHGVIHRDIALRNYVLTENLETPVLVDFGLSWPIAEEKYVQIRPKEMMPFRQCALEVLSALRYSKGSDIWMFGLSMWQLLHRGRQPFFQFVNGQELVQYLNNKMVQQNADIPLPFKKNGASQMAISTVKQMVVFCCPYDSDKRPTATQVLKKIESLRESANGEDDDEEEKVVSKYEPSENDVDGGLMAYNYTDYQNLKTGGQSDYIDLSKDLEHASLKSVAEVVLEQECQEQENEELEIVPEVQPEREDQYGGELKMVPELDAEQEDEGHEPEY